MRYSTFAATIFILSAIVFTAVLVHELPYTPQDALQYVDDNTQDRDDVYVWVCPTQTGKKTCILEMDVTHDDFQDSMNRNVFRVPTTFYPAPSNFILPNDPYVKRIAEHIDSETAGLSPDQKAAAACWFVQCAIRYASDSELYGTGDFWAYPVETLYSHRGDCEDTSILTASILEAMGFDAVLIDYPGHVEVGVKLDGFSGFGYAMEDGLYYLVETTTSGPSDIGITQPNNLIPEHIWHSDKSENGIAKTIASYRYLVKGFLSI